MSDFHATIIMVVVPVIWILIALVFANTPGNNAKPRKTDEDDFTVFSSVTDPSQSYLSYNVWHED